MSLRRAGWNGRKLRSRFARSRSRTRRPASPRAYRSRWWTARRSASPLAQGSASMAEKYTPRLKTVYDDEIRRALIEPFDYANTMAVEWKSAVEGNREDGSRDLG